MNNKQYFMMVFSLSIFGGIVIFLVYLSLVYKSNHPFGIFSNSCVTSQTTQQQSIKQIQSINDIDARINEQVFNHNTQRKTIHLNNRNITANVGQYRTIEDAEKGLQDLKTYLNNCSDDFCEDLINKASIKKEDWLGGFIYFLSIEHIDDPTLYALCNYMWNGNRKWAREHYHRCSDFRLWEIDP